MNIQNNLFLERLLSLSSSRFISIVINFGAIPILAAIYGPEQLGNFAYYLSLVIIASSISLLRLEVAIPRQSSIKGANKLLLQCVTIAPILVAVMTVGVLFLASLLNNSLYLSKIFIGFSIFAATLNSLFQNYYLAIEKYHAISIFDSFKSILIVVGQLVANFFFEKNGLEIGFLIGLSLICIIQILYCVPYIDKFENKKLLSLEEIKVLLKENESLLKFSSLSTLANSIINNIPIIFINSCYGALVSGYFYLAYKLLNAPIQVVGNSLRQLFYKGFSKTYQEKNNTSDLRKIYKKYLLTSSTLSIVSFCFLVLFSIYGFLYFFDSQWLPAVKIIYLLAVGFCIRQIAVSLSNITLVLHKEKIALYWNVASLVCLIAVILAVNYLSLSYIYFSILQSIVYIISYGSLIWIQYFVFLHPKNKRLNNS